MYSLCILDKPYKLTAYVLWNYHLRQETSSDKSEAFKYI